MIEHALALAARGFKVFPIAVGQKSPPLLNGWPQKATSDPKEIEMFWLAVPNANIGIHCDGLLVIDVDVKKGGHESLELLRLVEDLPATLCARTPSGGEHHYFKLPALHGGVPNGVDVLGRGVDIRSTGGYVVAPGSVVAAGAYAFEDAAREIAPAPEWLVARLGVARERTANAADSRVPDAAGVVVERAREWLRTARRSVKGQGGDQTAFAVACELRDLGVSYAQACDLMRSEAWDHGCGWRDGRLEEKPIRSAYRYAENEAGARAAQPDDFPAVLKSSTIAPETSTIAKRIVRTVNELAADESAGPGYVIKGLLQRASYAVEYGAPGEGKTFVALDQAYCVAAALPWMGRKVKGGPVAYLAYEGQGGMRKRAKALQRKYGTKDAPLYIVDASFNLCEVSGRQACGQAIAALPQKPVLIVIDTLHRALMGGDENSAQDMGGFNDAVAKLIEHSGACVLVIHHSGKDKSKGARGSSALLGAIDTEIEVSERQITASKQRDLEIGQAIGFKLVPVEVAIDEDGDGVTSCYVESATVASLAPLANMKPGERRTLQILEDLAPDNKPVTQAKWRTAAREVMSKSTAYDSIRALIKSGRVTEIEGYCSRRMV